MEDSERVALYRLHAGFCKTLADASRLLILNELAGGEASVGDLARRLALGQSNVSKHLGLMREHGLVVGAPRGGERLLRSFRPSHLPGHQAPEGRPGRPA